MGPPERSRLDGLECLSAAPDALRGRWHLRCGKGARALRACAGLRCWMPSSLVCSGAAAALLLAGTHIAGSPPNVPIAATATLVGAGALAETAEVTYGNTSVTFSAPVSLSAGTVLVFSAEPLATYTLAADIDAGEDG